METDSKEHEIHQSTATGDDDMAKKDETGHISAPMEQPQSSTDHIELEKSDSKASPNQEEQLAEKTTDSKSESKLMEKHEVQEREKHKNQEREKKTNEIIADIRKKVDIITEKYGFMDLCTLKILTKRPYTFVRPFYDEEEQDGHINVQQEMYHQSGELIYSVHNVFGTVGAFMVHQNDGTEVFAVTCAHVVGQHVEVYFQTNEKLGTTYTAIQSGANNLFPLVDIAVVKVDQVIKNRCLKDLKAEDGSNCKAHVVERNSNEVVGRRVFKYGGMTGLTKGMVVSGEFNIANNSEEHLIIIEPLPGDESPFAGPGDSGAIVCESLKIYGDGIDRLSAISMIQGGIEVEGEEQPLTLSFSLSKAFGLFPPQADVNLIFE